MSTQHMQQTESSKYYQELCSQLEIGKMTITSAVKRHLIFKFVFFASIWLALLVFATASTHVIHASIFYAIFGCWNILFSLNFAHDAAHDNLFQSQKLNFFCFATLYTLLGAHPHSWKKRHTHAHHHAPNVEGLDTDLAILKILRVLPQSERAWYHRYQVVYMPLVYMLYSFHWIFIKDPIYIWQHRSSQKKPINYVLNFILLKLIYFILIFGFPLYFSPLTVKEIATGFLMMHIVQSLFLSFTFIMTHHIEGTFYPSLQDQTINSTWMDNQIKSSNDIWPHSKLANFFFGGFNNHIAHHLFPTVHHYYYQKINQKLYPLLSENGYHLQHGSYWQGLYKHLRLLYLRGRF